MRGKRAKLWARTAGAGEARWLWARCQSIGVQRSQRNHHYQEIVYRFAVPHFGWNGRGYADWELDDGHFFDDGLYLDTDNYEGALASSPDAFTITNRGNRTVTNVILAITAGSAAITAITIACGAAHLVWTGTVASGNLLLIDAGSYRVLNDGNDAYSGLSFATNHAIEDWIRLEPGANTLTFTWTGGGSGSVYSLNFWDGWY